MKLSIKKLLDFFDDKKDSLKGDANALSAILGEDLNASAYKHFRKNSVEILNNPVLPGSMKGNRLDRWIFDKKNNKLFQSEIKNWSATAIGGKQLKSNASDEEVGEISKYHWSREQKNSLSKKASHPNKVSKVLLHMKTPSNFANLEIEPLLIYWMPISSDIKGLNPLSSIYVSDFPIETTFSTLYIFSVSLYLRYLLKNGEKYIELDMPHFEHRMQILSDLQKI
jgi:hypothetical protein